MTRCSDIFSQNPAETVEQKCGGLRMPHEWRVSVADVRQQIAPVASILELLHSVGGMSSCSTDVGNQLLHVSTLLCSGVRESEVWLCGDSQWPSLPTLGVAVLQFRFGPL